MLFHNPISINFKKRNMRYIIPSLTQLLLKLSSFSAEVAENIRFKHCSHKCQMPCCRFSDNFLSHFAECSHPFNQRYLQ